MNFYSKKNRVTLEDGVVIKRHSDVFSSIREARALTELREAGLAVPFLLGRDENVIRMEYIPGEIYHALTEEMTPEHALALADWLAKYHDITGLLRGDVNLRNFIWNGRECVGVDFEDVPAAGEREADMGKILAFAVTYKPCLSPGKTECARQLLRAFVKTGGRKEKIRSFYLGEILDMERRRKGDFPGAEALGVYWEEFDR
ncbi:MAG TPA: hypothetical protein GX704_04080 [Clostridiales bacterium]|nr:hypothetical protein [Clostridiales bacterium]